MKVVLALSLFVAVASAGLIPAPAAYLGPAAIVRTPSLDSAVIKSDRIGGNFAYSSVEGHAYAAVQPVIQEIPTPVGVSYSASPITVAAGPAIATTHLVSGPAYGPAYGYAGLAGVGSPVVVA